MSVIMSKKSMGEGGGGLKTVLVHILVFSIASTKPETQEFGILIVDLNPSKTLP